MKPAMALLKQQQKDGHSQLFHRMYSLQITQDKNKGEAGGREDERKRGTEWEMIELVLIRGQSCDLLLNFVLCCLCLCMCVGNLPGKHVDTVFSNRGRRI